MSRIGILAGGGGLPVAVAQSILQSGRDVFLIGIDGEAEPSIEQFPHTWSNMGSVGRMVQQFRQHGCQEVVIVGSVKRPDIAKLRPDLGFVTNFPAIVRLLFGGDNSVLSRVVRFFEGKGFIVRGAHEVAPDLVAHDGVIGRVSPDSQAREDIASGLSLITKLGPLDVGQAVIISQGRVLAIEGAEGTDRMLERCAAKRDGIAAAEALQTSTGVLVKRPKPGQELRVDMPTIGPRTVQLAAEAGLSGLAVLSGHVLVAEIDQLKEIADGHEIFVTGVSYPLDEANEEVGVHPGPPLAEPVIHSRRRPGRREKSDLAKGARVILTLAPFKTGDAVVVVRDYVVAVKADDSVAEMLVRSATLRQWGAGASSPRRGVLVVRRDLVLAGNGEMIVDTNAIIEAAAAAGLAGVVLFEGETPNSIPSNETIASVEAQGMFLASLQQADASRTSPSNTYQP